MKTDLKPLYVGKWRIDELELWVKNFINLVVPGHVTIRKDATGTFQFCAVQGEMDFRNQEVKGIERLLFSWQGNDDYDETMGMGWLEVDGKRMNGWIQFYKVNDSGFTATME